MVKVRALMIAAAGVLACLTGTANSQTYNGSFDAVITRGSFRVAQIFDPRFMFNLDLTGTRIVVNYSAFVATNYVNLIGDVQPRYVQANIAVSGLPTFSFNGGPAYGGSVSADATNDTYLSPFYGTADFVPTGPAGILTIIEHRLSQNAYLEGGLSYDAASRTVGPVTGSGYIDADLPGFTWPDQYYSFEFALISGFAGVPEPNAWLLMIGGMGLVGSALRRRSVMRNLATLG